MNAIPIEPLHWPSEVALSMPGSKSEANRLLVAAALCGRRVTVRGASPSDDVRHLLAGLATLGFDAAYLDGEHGTAQVGPRRHDAPGTGTIDCGNAGTALRFLVSLAAITPGEWILTGDAAMQRRPIGPLVAAWRQLGIDIEDTNGCPPVRVRGGVPQGDRVTVDASVSSQFVSSLLLVAANLARGLAVGWAQELASPEYVHLTRRALQRVGVETATMRDAIVVQPGHRGAPAELTVGGDWSAMGIWSCLDHLTGSRVVGDNLIADSSQADEHLVPLLATLADAGDRTIDVRAMPDQFPNLAVVAAHRTGTTTFVHGENLRIKECDRIAVMARELAKLGVRVEERPDGLVVHGGRPPGTAMIDPANDHRIAMAFALAGLLAPGVTIQNPGCVAKSYPTFWRDLAHVQRSLRCLCVIGMRGAGKSTFATALSAATGLPTIDTDRLFEQRFQPIPAFVAKYGWHNFREQEAALVAEALRPGTIVATGGGAIEHPATQTLLAERAIVVWLDADAATLRAHVLADARERPSITGAPVDQEIELLLARRLPLYRRAATIRIDATATTDDQVAEALRRLRLLRDTSR